MSKFHTSFNQFNRSEAEFKEFKPRLALSWNRFLADLSRGSNSLNSDTELGTFVLDTHNPDSLISISNVDTFNLGIYKKLSILVIPPLTHSTLDEPGEISNKD